MTKKRRNLILVAGLVALVAVGAAVAVGIALGGDEDHKPRYPGRIAVRDDCGLVHFFQDGSDQKTLCLTDAWDAVSLSWNGKKLAWDTRATGIRIADENGENEYASRCPRARTSARPSRPTASRWRSSTLRATTAGMTSGSETSTRTTPSR